MTMPGSVRLAGSACSAATGVVDFFEQQHALQQDRVGALATTTFTCGFASVTRHLAIAMPARSAASRAYSGGRIPSRRAQAIRSLIVWQQQFRQQCSAVRQPQGQFSQG